MIKIGLTGGIGSGKSYVANKFNLLGIPIFYTDDIAKEQYNKEEVKEKLIKEFGSIIYKNNEINKDLLKQIVYDTDKTSKTKLVDIVHLYVFEDYKIFLDKHQNCKYTILESAILFENNLTNYFDKIVSVISNKDVRIDRIIKRSNLTLDEINIRMNCQYSDEFIIKNSDYIIYNNDSLDEQIMNINSILIK